MGDGIRFLRYSAEDKAGNSTEASATIKIDTRGPVTDGAEGWVNGLKPYVLTATDQVPGAGVAATVYRVDQKTPWSINEATPTVGPTLATSITLSGGQGAMHTVDFASVDAALPLCYSATDRYGDGTLVWPAPSFHYGNWELDILNILKTGAAYKSRSVKLDVTAPAVTVTGNDDRWHNAPVTLDFSATDVGAGVDYIEWSTDGTNWTKGNSAKISENGEITVSYRAVDKVGIVSATQTVKVWVSTTPPKVASTSGTITVKNGNRATFGFNVTAITPTVTLYIDIRDKATGRTYIHKRFANVATNADGSRSFKVKMPKKGKFNYRISATDQAGNVQSVRGRGTIVVK